MNGELPKFVNYDYLRDFKPPRNPVEDESHFWDIVDSKETGLLGLHFTDEEVRAYLLDIVNSSECRTRSEARRHQPSFVQKTLKLGKGALQGFINSGGGASIKAY